MTDPTSDLIAESAPLPHERRASAFEVYQIRIDLDHLRPMVNHVTDEGEDFWEVWFIHNNRPVVFRYYGERYDLDTFSEMLHKAVVAYKEGHRGGWVSQADLFAKRVREMLHGERWVDLKHDIIPPTRKHRPDRRRRK